MNAAVERFQKAFDTRGVDVFTVRDGLVAEKPAYVTDRPPRSARLTC